MISKRQQFVKRIFDVILATVGLVAVGWLIGLVALIARWDTGKSGIFRQMRVGRNGELFDILKVRTMRDVSGFDTSVTTSSDPRITQLGRLFRLTKIDELPQLLNILRGEMSFVGPRPDVPAIANRLQHEAPLVLKVRPGITGPASLKYRNEEQLLQTHADPEWANWHVVFPDKMRINTSYVENYRFTKDLRYLWQTIFGTYSAVAIQEITQGVSHDQHAA